MFARDGAQMTQRLRELRHDAALRKSLSEHGRETVLNRHTCRHRADELLAILGKLGLRERAHGERGELGAREPALEVP